MRDAGRPAFPENANGCAGQLRNRSSRHGELMLIRGTARHRSAPARLGRAAAPLSGSGAVRGTCMVDWVQSRAPGAVLGPREESVSTILVTFLL